MVNTESVEELHRRPDKVPFQYQVPKIKASFTLQVVPDMLTSADLPEKNNQGRIEQAKKSMFANNNSTLLFENPHLPSINIKHNAPNLTLKPQKPCISVPPTIHHPHKVRPAGNRSGQIVDDDKDFEIPLEESLKAVEDFIKREKELSNWRVGEDVLAKWKGNGLYYKARILEIFPSGVVSILFDCYNIKEDIDYHDMSKYFKKSSHYKKKGEPASTEAPKETRECSDDRKQPFTSKEIINDQADFSYNHHPLFGPVLKRQMKAKKQLLLAAHRKGRKNMVIRSKKLKSKNKMSVIHPKVSDKEIKFYCPWG